MLPFDLHVLSIPPAFNLSQDQTLQFNSFPITISHRAAFTAKAIERRFSPKLNHHHPVPASPGKDNNSQLKLKQGTSFTSIAKATNAKQAPL